MESEMPLNLFISKRRIFSLLIFRQSAQEFASKWTLIENIELYNPKMYLRNKLVWVDTFRNLLYLPVQSVGPNEYIEELN